MMSSVLGYAVAPRVTRVDVVQPYRLAVAFMDGSEQNIDLEPLSGSRWFEPLRDPAVFRQVVIDPHGSPLWPNHAMLPVWTLHDWPTAGTAFVADVQKRERGERRLRIFQVWFTAAMALWFLGLLASWAGWIGGEPATLKDVTFAAVMVTQNAGSMALRRSAAWGVALVLASLALFIAYLTQR